MILGRDAELSVLRRLCRSAAAGAGGAVLLEGMAGIGKSALLASVGGESGGLRPLWGRAPEEGGAPAYWPWYEIAAAGGWAVDWASADDPFTLSAQVARVARQAAGEGPLLLLVDDLHAADDATISLTGYLAKVLRDAPIALVVAARPDPRLDLLARACETVLLGPLDDGSADELLDRHARRPLDAEARTAIKRAAEGSPLVLRELALSASPRTLPRGVRVAVVQRLAPLDDVARGLVDRAAVLGRRFDLGVLATLAGMTGAEVLGALDPAVRHGLIEGDGERRSFSHQIVRDVVYAALPAVDRLAAHRDAGELAQRGERPVEAARHLLAAVPLVEPAVAVEAARFAATAAPDGSPGDPVGLLDAALRVVDDASVRLDLLLELGGAQLTAGRVGAAAGTLDEAVARAGDLGDERRRAQALLRRTERVETRTNVREHLPPLGAAIEVARRGEDTALVANLLQRRSMLRGVVLEREAALADATESVELARPLDDAPLLVAALTALHQCYWEPATAARSAETSAELVAVADSTGDLGLRFDAVMAWLVDALRAGDLAGVGAALDRLAEIAAQSGSLRHEFFVLSRRAMQAFTAGHLVAGRQLIERARELGERIEEPDATQVYWGAQFMVLAELHDPDELHEVAGGFEGMDPTSAFLAVVVAHFRAAAGDAARQATVVGNLIDSGMVDLATSGHELSFFSLVAQVAVAAGDARLAAAIEPVLVGHRGQFIVNSGAVTFCGLVDHWLGSLAAVGGRHDDARELLTESLDRYRTIGARFFELRVERELAALDDASPATEAPAGAGPRLAVLRPVDGGWEVGWASAPVRLADARGLHHLRRLVAQPGVEVHAADLVSPGSAELVRGRAREALLDDDAKRAYRRRIADLQAEVERAGRRGQVEREDQAQAELDLLLDELRRAVGLGGRDRQPANDAERARVAVRKAISATLARLAEHAPDVAAHLRTSVRTGLYCSYSPDPTVEVRWTTD